LGHGPSAKEFAITLSTSEFASDVTDDTLLTGDDSEDSVSMSESVNLTDDEVIKKRERRVRNRTRCMHEMVTTEETYVAQLDAIIEYYAEPLRNGQICGLKEKHHSRLFPVALTTLRTLHENLSGDLQEVDKNFDPASTIVSKVFLSFAPYFKMYKAYVKIYKEARLTLRKVEQRNEKFKEYQKSKMEACNGLNLASLIITPIQRVPRYELLLRDMIKNMEEEHPDYSELNKAYELVKAVNLDINQDMADFESQNQVVDIEQQFRKRVNLIAPSRKFVKMGKMHKRGRKEDQLYTWILFNDLLIYASGKEGAYLLHNQLSIDDNFTITDLPDTDDCPHRFAIASSVKSFVVHCKDAEEKKDWYTAIRKQKQQTLKRVKSLLTLGGAAPGTRKSVKPVWESDHSAKQCTQCGTNFTLFTRRHHCRFCGALVCHSCSKYKLPDDKKFKQRACALCVKDFADIQNGVDIGETRASTLPTGLPSFVEIAKEMQGRESMQRASTVGKDLRMSSTMNSFGSA